MNHTEVKALFDNPCRTVLTSHRNPDGDAIGSSTALALILRRLGHDVKILYPSDYPSDFGYLPEVQDAVIFDVNNDAALKIIEQAELFFSLDYNGLDRIDKMGVDVLKNPCPKILIDHHLDPEDFADYTLSETAASSTCELVYIFLESIGLEDMIDADVATCLYTGILTDTGSFKYSTSPRLFEVCAKLLNKGVDDVKVQQLIHDNMREKQLRLLGHCLANRMEIIPEYSTAIIHLTKRDYEQFDIQRGDTEGVVNYLLRVKGVKLAAFITRQPKITKLSLRSKGDFSVQEMAGKYFNGGGHKNASGGYSYKALDIIIERFKSILPEYAEQLRP